MKEELIIRLIYACRQAWKGSDDDGHRKTNIMFGWTQVGDGWFGLLEDLSKHIQAELIQHPEPRFRFTAVKEKYGRLVVQHEGSENDGIYMIIDSFADKSVTVCESCGSGLYARVRDIGEGFLKTLCVSCFEPHEGERSK